jgi:hypothetical protein
MLKNRKPVKVSNKPVSKGARKPVVKLVAAEPERATPVPPKARKAAAVVVPKAAKLPAAAKPVAKAPKPIAKAPKAPKAAHDVVAPYIAHCTKEFSQTYANSLLRPLNAFGEWLESRKLDVSELEDKHLVRYRALAEAQGLALSTTRMSLARVQTFLRWAGCKANLSVLRIQHTEEEKEARAEAAQ